MTEIERWNSNDAWPAAGSGEFVRYEDYRSELEAEKENAARLREKVALKMDDRDRKVLLGELKTAEKRVEAAEKALKELADYFHDREKEAAAVASEERFRNGGNTEASGRQCAFASSRQRVLDALRALATHNDNEEDPNG